MQQRKLTPGEITKAVEKIRRRYDLYTRRYYKSPRLRYAFEDRYLQALEARVDVSTFLMAEISAVEELIRREEERISSAPARGPDPKKESFADRVLAEQLERIQKYPDAVVHPDVREDVRRLLGALDELERERWLSLGMALRDTAYSRYSVTTMNLESELRYLAVADSDGVPAGLMRLLYHLGRFPRDYSAIDREEKDYILKSAFFLHDLSEIVERVAVNYPGLAESDRENLGQTLGYIRGIIEDFRLKDFKRRK